MASTPRLLFLTDRGTDDVDIFSLPELTLKGRLTGFTLPAGECSDAFGDVWVANVGAYQMRRYSRTGALLSTLTESYGYPSYCAVNKADNTLAVSNLEDKYYHPGQVLIYKNATGSPSLLTNPQQYYYYADAYDPAGNLFVIGRAHSRQIILSECAAGSDTCHTITIAGATIYFPSVLQWYHPGNYLVLGDAQCRNKFATCLYRFSISGSTAMLLGETTLENYKGSAACIVYDPAIAGSDDETFVVGGSETTGNRGCGKVPPNAARWAFPAGGKPTDYNASAGLSQPFGAAISAKPRRAAPRR
ncbi:MAG: hypothetical protein WB615_15670 [Candidatus Tumulicola sp.]